MDVITVAFAENNEIYFKGLYTLLKKMRKIVITAAAHDDEELVRLLDRRPADVVITNIQMPRQRGMEAIRIIVAKHPSTKVIGLTMLSTEYTIIDLLKAGACGILDKHTKPVFLEEAIRAVHDGQCFYCPASATLVSKICRSSNLQVKDHISFSEDELKLINLLCQDYSVKEIAPQVCKSESTVIKHRKQILDKMGVKSIAGMIVYAMQKGLLKEEG